MTRLSEHQVLDALKTVLDPSTRRDVVSLGMIGGLTLKDGNVFFAIEIDPSRAAELEPMRRAAEAAVERLDGVLSVTAALTAHKKTAQAPPAQAHGHDHGHDHGPAPRGPGPGQSQPGQSQPGQSQPGQSQKAPAKAMVPGVRSIVAVASGKGGVGKSTTAVNLACALAANGLSVGLLDADIYGPSQPRMLGISGRPTSHDGKVLEPMVNHGVKCMSMGFLVPEDTPMIWRGPMVMSALNQMLRDVNWGTLDILVVDMPPGTGDAQLTMAQQVPLAGAVIVSTPQDIALLDARKGLNMFRKVDVPVLGIIENMSYFCCPNCGHRTNIFSHGGARDEAARLGTPFLGEIPLDIAIRETSDAGRPIVIDDPASPHAQAYRSIATTIWTAVQAGLGGGSRPPPRIVIQ